MKYVALVYTEGTVCVQFSRRILMEHLHRDLPINKYLTYTSSNLKYTINFVTLKLILEYKMFNACKDICIFLGHNLVSARDESLYN